MTDLRTALAQQVIVELSAEWQQIINEQRQGNNHARTPPKSGSAESIFEWYLRGFRFSDIYKEAMQRYLGATTEESIDEIEKSLAGRLFQDISYSILSQQTSDLLISPERTLRIFELLNPNAKKTKHNFGLDSLERISVPDGLIMRTEDDIGRILSICEYTTSHTEAYFNRKYAGLKKLIDKFPLYFYNAQIIFVVPTGNQLPSFLVDEPKVSRVELLFTFMDFSRFLKSVYSRRFMGKNNANLSGIRDRVVHQHEKIRDTLNRRQLTEEQADYLARHFASASTKPDSYFS